MGHVASAVNLSTLKTQFTAKLNSDREEDKNEKSGYNPFEAENIFQLPPKSETPSPAPRVSKTRSPNF